MHWSEKIAQEIVKRNPDKPEYVCAAGISPSGSIHIGNFRDVATSYFVVRALRKMGKKARLLFSWDEFDRLRKIPVNVAQVDEDMENTSAILMWMSLILLTMRRRIPLLRPILKRNLWIAYKHLVSIWIIGIRRKCIAVVST